MPSAAPEATTPDGPHKQTSPGLREMIRVYETCIRIREVSKQQLTLSEDMALIAINAEIAAAKSNVNQEAFMILASETGKIARQMSEHVAHVLADADALAQNALVGVVKARRLDKMAQGLSGIRRAENVRRVELVASEVRQALGILMGRILSSQEEIEAARLALSKQNQRVSRIITYFRIEASRDSEHGAFFRNIADDLTKQIGLAQTISQELHHILSSGR